MYCFDGLWVLLRAAKRVKWRSATERDGGGGGELGKPSRGICISSRQTRFGGVARRGELEGPGPPGQGRASWSPAAPEASLCHSEGARDVA